MIWDFFDQPISRTYKIHMTEYCLLKTTYCQLKTKNDSPTQTMNKLTYILFLILSTTIFAQEVEINGTINDDTGKPLEMANVIATDKESGAIESYAISNYEGRYRLHLPADKTFVLKASFLGYETVEKEVNTSSNASNLDITFTLNPKADQLDGVEIVYEMPVTVKGDTIVYNADSFTDGTERKLGDVMKKLPGIEINDEGEIQVEGKAVNKVMVEEKDFFDGDSKLATKNIPADAVDKVQVLRNYNEVDQMRGLGNDQDNIAINIKLKEGKKNFWFGEVTAGGGFSEGQGRYLAHPKLFYYNPKYSLNFITDFNNIGEVPFTWRDYFKFTGGFRNFNRGTSFSVNSNDLGFAITQNNRANALETNFFAGNFSWQTSKSLDLSGFAILSDNKTNMVTNTLTQYITSNASENRNGYNNLRSRLGMLKLSSVYKPNVNFQLDYDALIKVSKQTEDAQLLSVFDSFSNTISEAKENTPVSVNQNINAYYTLNDKNIFAAQMQHLWQDEDPFYQAVTQLFPFQGVLPLNNNQTAFNINQDKNIKTNKLDATVDYYYVINNKSNINFTLGNTYSNQKFNSQIFQILDDNTTLPFTESPPVEGEIFPLKNDVKFRFNDAFLGLHYKVKTGKFIFTPGVSLHNYSLINDQLGTSVSQNNWNLFPDLNVLLQLKKSESLTFDYRITAEYTDVNNYAEAFVFNNYNRLFRGNRNLENSLSHTYNLRYFSFNMFNYTNIHGNLSYSKRVNGFKNQTAIAAINQVSTIANIESNFPDETFSGFVGFSKRVKKLQFKLNANVAYMKAFNTINNVIQKSKSFTQNYRGSILSNFNNAPNFEVGYRILINDYDNGGLKQTFYTHRPFINVDYTFLKNFTFTADYNYYNYTNKTKTIDNTYAFLDATLFYQKGESPWEFSIQATNILDTKFINNDSFNEQFNSTSQYFVLPRIMMFVIKYDL